MKKLFYQFILKGCFVLVAVGCGTNEGGTGIANPPSSTVATNSLSAMAALFQPSAIASSQSAVLVNHILSLFVSDARAIGGASTCSDTPPDAISFDYDGEATDFADGTHTYGAASQSLTLELDDFCNDSNFPLVENTGTGPDGNGLFLSYTFRVDSAATATCASDDGVMTATLGGAGVYRLNGEHIELYGLFHTLSDSSEFDANCTLILNMSDGSVFDGVCSDIDTNEDITLGEVVSCEISVTSADISSF
jgi:hypothetical protein